MTDAPPPADPHAYAKAARQRLERDVRALDYTRHWRTNPAGLKDAEDFIALELGSLGLRVERHLFSWREHQFHNVIGTRDGTDPSRPWIVAGAHFDTTEHTPGADDNASGVAAMLEIARRLQGEEFPATVQFVGFNLEEHQQWTPPFSRFGSKAYVRWLTDQVARVDGAFVLEMVGCTEEHQRVPVTARLFRKVSTRGDFVAAIADGNSRHLLHAMERANAGLLPMETLSVPFKGFVVPDTRRSDNARFWDADYPAIMVTDTANLRNHRYHKTSDTCDTLDFVFMEKVVTIVTGAMRELAR